MNKSMVMGFGLVLLLLVQLTTIDSAVAGNSTVEPTVPAKETATNATESPGFIKKVTTQMENLACKVGFFCGDAKAAEKGKESDKDKSAKSETESTPALPSEKNETKKPDGST